MTLAAGLTVAVRRRADTSLRRPLPPLSEIVREVSAVDVVPVVVVVVADSSSLSSVLSVPSDPLVDSAEEDVAVEVGLL